MCRFADASHRHIPPMLGPPGNKQCKPTVQWKHQFSGRTDCLIEWCNANPTEHLKLFADSSQAAQEEGRAKETNNQSKKAVYLPLVSRILVFLIQNFYSWYQVLEPLHHGLFLRYSYCKGLDPYLWHHYDIISLTLISYLWHHFDAIWYHY